MKRNLLYVIFILFFQAGLNAQSDEPCSATTLTVFSDCNSIAKTEALINPPTYTNSTSASAGVTLPSLTCGGFSSSSLDFWYKVVVPASGRLIISMEPGGNPSTQATTAWDAAVYRASSATCAGSTFTELATECTAAKSPAFELTGLTPGETLYIRVWRQANLAQTANRGYKIWATDGGVFQLPTCATLIAPSGSILGDAHLKWNTTANTDSFQLFLAEGATLYTLGNYVNQTDPVSNFFIPSGFSSGTVILNPSQTYTWYIEPFNCAGRPLSSCSAGALSFVTPPRPSNDNCANATSLAVDVEINTTSGQATQSQNPATCSNATSSTATDVWYKFSTGPNGGSADIFVTTDENMDAVVEAFTGSCGSLTSIGCVDEVGESDIENLAMTNLPPNSTIYVRVYAFMPSSYAAITGEPFTIFLTGTAVPIELVSFSGNATGSGNTLKWVTATERNVKEFVLERSDDGAKNFETIGAVKAAGLSQTNKSYEFFDTKPLALGYYRLRSVDFDGKEQVSRVISIQRTDKRLAINKIYPTLTKEAINVQYVTVDEQNVEFTITDILGRVIWQKKANTTEGPNFETINVADLQSGMYWFRINNGNETVESKFIKQ